MMNNLYTQRREERKKEKVPSSVQNVKQAQIRNKSKSQNAAHSAFRGVEAGEANLPARVNGGGA